MKVLICDSLSEVGIKIFQDCPEIQVDVKTGIPSSELKEIINQYHGLVISGNTQIDSDVIERAEDLKVIGRAGTGLDNLDLNAASKKGIVIMNTPDADTISAAEHTMAMIMALSRNIPQGTASLKQGKWEKVQFQGREVFNKTLGLIGAGHVGRIVAERAKGMKMKVIVYDPYIKPETIEKLDLEPVSFDGLLMRSDYVTLHTPRTDETENMIDREAISRMKRGSMLINCARGGIVDEDALFEALESNHLAGAALDVFRNEPPADSRLMSLPNLICTPNLGASTKEARDNMAREIAEQIKDYLLYGTVRNAVNVPSVSAELMNILRPYVILAEKLGAFQGQLTEAGITEVMIDYSGRVLEYDTTVLTTAVLKGLLSPILKDDVNFINASIIAAERGIKVTESRTSTADGPSSLIKLRVKSLDGENLISGSIFGKTLPRIIRINDFYLEAIPDGHNLLIHNLDIPGMIGNIATRLGNYNVNISRMAVGQEKSEKQNVILLSTNMPVEDHVLEELRGIDNIFSVRKIEL